MARSRIASRAETQPCVVWSPTHGSPCSVTRWCSNVPTNSRGSPWLGWDLEVRFEKPYVRRCAVAVAAQDSQVCRRQASALELPACLGGCFKQSRHQALSGCSCQRDWCPSQIHPSPAFATLCVLRHPLFTARRTRDDVSQGDDMFGETPCEDVNVETMMRLDAGSTAPTRTECVKHTYIIPTFETFLVWDKCGRRHLSKRI